MIFFIIATVLLVVETGAGYYLFRKNIEPKWDSILLFLGKYTKGVWNAYFAERTIIFITMVISLFVTDKGFPDSLFFGVMFIATIIDLVKDFEAWKEREVKEA